MTAPLTRDEHTRPAAPRRYVMPLRIEFRLCHEDDLPALEWYGLFWAHREIIRDAFDRQRRGEVLMLLAITNGFPVGQAWMDLARLRSENGALLWAVRVFPFLQGRALGARLIARAERLLAARQIAFVEVGAEKDNPRARRLYERLGYRLTHDAREEYAFTTPDGEPVRVRLDEWCLRKPLAFEPRISRG
jgi:ribosomal protein S18 acetylase RimI-like enzyme